MVLALKRGIGPDRIWLLTVHGRKTGKPHSTPVSLVSDGPTRYLVSPYGEREWVKNARANGKVTISRGSSYETRPIREIGPAEAAEVLRRYYSENSVTHPYFDVNLNSTDLEFEAEAPRHPVFRLA